MIYFSPWVICGPKCDGTCLSHCHRTCWGYSADLLWSGTVWGRNPGPPGPQSSGSCPQRRPLSWTRWAASAGRGAGSCRTAAEGPGGSWRRWTWATAALCIELFVSCGNVWRGALWNLVMFLFCLCRRVLKFRYWSAGLLLTLPRTSGVLPSSRWSALRCSGWRKGSWGAGLEVLSFSGKRKNKVNIRRKKQEPTLLFFETPAYIGMELALSFCLSHTNSLYLLLTHEIFLVKHTLVVWHRTSQLFDGWGENSRSFHLLTCKQIS